jgi:hypothetical protein
MEKITVMFDPYEKELSITIDENYTLVIENFMLDISGNHVTTLSEYGQKKLLKMLANSLL